jgi:hypothetical protein
MVDTIDTTSSRENDVCRVTGHDGAAIDIEERSCPQDPKTLTNGNDDIDDSEALQSPPRLERWNESRTNICRFGVTLFGFTIMGMNDAVLGVSVETPVLCRCLSCSSTFLLLVRVVIRAC